MNQLSDTAPPQRPSLMTYEEKAARYKIVVETLNYLLNMPVRRRNVQLWGETLDQFIAERDSLYRSLAAHEAHMRRKRKINGG